MKNVLVTGADGFIGSHLVEELVRSGARVKAFVMYNSFNSWGWLDTVPEEVLEQVEIFSGDINLVQDKGHSVVDGFGAKRAANEILKLF